MSNFALLLQDKKEGVTSFDSLRELKKKYKGEKIGHSGTLDKAASGLMLVMIGGATKLNPLFSNFDKRYTASILFGEERDTLDRYGSVIATSSYIPTLSEIEKILPSFIGKIKQKPPLYSALHKDGERLYKIARNGKDVDIDERDVEIYDLNILSYEKSLLILDCRVSKGTYIRSLSRDLALSLNTRGSLLALRRTEIGSYTLSDLTLDTFSLLQKTNIFSKVNLDINSKKYIDNGNIIKENILFDSDKSKEYAISYFDDKPYAVLKKSDALKIIARF